MPGIERRANRKTWVNAFICITLTIFVIAFSFALLVREVPLSNNEVLLLIIGMILGEWKSQTGWWTQSTRSSEEKSRLLANSVPSESREDQKND